MFKKKFKTFLVIFVVLLILNFPAPAQSSGKSKNTKNANISLAKPEPGQPSELQKKIFDEINLVRTNPAVYIKFLENLKNSMKDKVVKLPDGTRYLIQGGADSIDDAIRDLKKVPKLKPYKFSSGLSAVADLQLTELKENIKLGHFGSDGSDLEIRMYKIGIPGTMIAENIAYKSETAVTVVLNMIIDESSKTRAHRKNLLSPGFNEIGIAYGKNKDNYWLCVIDFTDKFTEKTVKNGANRVL